MGEKWKNTAHCGNYCTAWSSAAAAAVKSNDDDDDDDDDDGDEMLLRGCLYAGPTDDKILRPAQSPITPTSPERTPLDNEALCVGFR